MVSLQERQRLVEQMQGEIAGEMGIALKCLAGLLMVIALAVVNVATRTDTMAPIVGATSLPALVAHEETASVAAARKVFEERRVRFERRQSAPQQHRIVASN